jgi:hypothetical protein
LQAFKALLGGVQGVKTSERGAEICGFRYRV